VITETSAVAFRQNLGEMLNIVQYRNDSVLIKKDGKPVAALIDARLFERIRRMQDRFDALSDRLEQTYAGVAEDVALAEIEQASALARRETADAWRASGRLPALPLQTAVKPAKAAKRSASAKKVATTKPKSKAAR
jgi:prevent-host-death family protein